jgi:hypothetical protein
MRRGPFKARGLATLYVRGNAECGRSRVGRAPHIGIQQAGYGVLDRA